MLRNRVCPFTVATLISGPAYGGRWWWATILNALSSSSSSSSASSSSFSSSKFIFCQVILLPCKQRVAINKGFHHLAKNCKCIFRECVLFEKKRCSSYSELWVTVRQCVLITTAKKQQKNVLDG